MEWIPMIQKGFKEAIFELVKEVSGIKQVYSVILFGSVVRGEATSASDIDILIIVSNMKIEKRIIEISKEIGRRYDKRFQVIVKTRKLKGLDPSMIEDIGKDGLLLYGLPVKVKQKDLDLEPYLIAVYSLADLPQAEKMKFRRSIFGSKSVFRDKNKKYVTVQDGILKMYDGARLGRGAIIFPSKRKEIVRQLEYFKVKFKVFTVYCNKDTLGWINTFNRSIR